MPRSITIGREFGSGGRELGRRLAETLKIAYYDHEIIAEIARRTSLSEQYIQSVSERAPVFSFPIHTGRSFYPAPNPAFDQSLSVYREQSNILREMAEKSDCVIVGRCADYVLKDYHPFRIFVCANMESKMQRCRENAPEDEKLTDRELRQMIQSVDKRRAGYYSFYTGQNWGDRLNVDICINTSRMVIKEVVPAFARLFD